MDREKSEFKKYKANIEKCLIKKALGYSYNEVIEEFNVEEGEEKLVKRKVTTKNVPPDVSAVKVLLEMLNVDSGADFSKLSDEELKTEIKKALDILENNYKGEDNGD